MRKILVAAALVASTGCYHVTVDTGRTPNGQVIENNWANSFVYGLVPPATVETASKCPSGVAKVETQQSFLNGLVSGLTFGLYTPWTIKVQCAGSGRTGDATIIRDADVAAGIAKAADVAVATSEAVYVQTR
jgi:hypothetical protein